MKRFFRGLFVLLMAFIPLIMVGCGSRYGKITITASFYYSGEETLSNGNIRYSNNGSVFDKTPDDTYIFYMTPSMRTVAYLNVTFTDEPKNFRYDVNLTPTSIVSIASNIKYIPRGVQCSLTARDIGEQDIDITSYECDKKTSIRIRVVNVIDEIEFKEDAKNMALPNKAGSHMTFNDKLDIPPSSITRFKYNFGIFDEAGSFVPFENRDAELRGYGFTFDDKLSKLTLQGRTSLNNLGVQITYENPLDSSGDKTIIGKIKIIVTIENLEIFKGSSYEDATSKNKIDEDTVYDFVTNLHEENLNYMNIILKVRSNGENVTFFSRKEGESPFDKADQLGFPISVEYYDDKGSKVSSYDEAIYTYAYYTLKPTKVTTNANYKNDIFKMQIGCDYLNYVIDDFVLVTYMSMKCHELISTFLINGKSLQSFPYIDEENFNHLASAYSNDSCVDANIYMATGQTAIPTKISVDVYPPQIANEDSKFGIKIFKVVTSSRLEKVSNALKLSVEGEGLITNETQESFSRGSIFWITPNEANVALKDTFYMLIYAKKPEKSKFGRNAVFVRLHVVQGISKITGFNYTYTCDTLEQDIEGYEDFGDDGSSVQVLNMLRGDGISSIKSSAYITLNFSPTQDITIENLKVEPKNKGVVTTEIVDSLLGTFNVYPGGVGSTDVIISVDSLETKYVIHFNVYESINTFKLILNETRVVQGVGKYVNTDYEQSAVVEAQRAFDFSLVTLPISATQYSVYYSLFKIEGENRVKIGEYTKSAGTMIGESYEIRDSNLFKLDCIQNSFEFLSDSAKSTYVIHVEIKNLMEGIRTGSLIEELTLSCYVPIKNMDLFSTLDYIYDPNTIYYADKITSEEDLGEGEYEDKTVFGIGVKLNKGGRVPTFNFEDYGKIIAYINGEEDCEFSISGGILNLDYARENSALSIFSPMLFRGHYWFKLNENYTHDGTGSVDFSFQVDEMGYYVSNYISLPIKKASRIVSFNSDVTNLEFRQGLDFEKTVDFTSKAEGGVPLNPKVESRIYTLLNISGNIMWVMPDGIYTYDKTLSPLDDIYSLKLKIAQDFDYAGRATLFIIPQDRLTSEQEYDIFNSYVYKKVDILAEDFTRGIYYTEDKGIYTLSSDFNEDATYFVKKVNDKYISSIWPMSLVIGLDVTNGKDVAYHISSEEELRQITQSEEYCTKRYVLTRDILCTENWKTLGNYYRVEVSNAFDPDEPDKFIFKENEFYVRNEGTYTYSLAKKFDTKETYYLYGFNGELSGMYTYMPFGATGGERSAQYGIYNLHYDQSFHTDEKINEGLFATLGREGKICNIHLGYNMFQPRITKDVIFGGVTGINYGNILNVRVDLGTSLRMRTSYPITFGGITGINYGNIYRGKSECEGCEESQDLNQSGVNGSIAIAIERLPSTPSVSGSFYIGGLAGVNYGIIKTEYDELSSPEYIFNDIWFDSSVRMSFENDGDIKGEESALGGAVGLNLGQVSGISTQGKINCGNIDNVGGIIGINKNIDGRLKAIHEDMENSIEDCYSTMIVICDIKGDKNIGGGIGQILGRSKEDAVKVHNVSVENCVTDYHRDRVFVEGFSNVGGLVGSSNCADISYSFCASYFDCESILEEQRYESSSYDIVGDNNVGGLIGNAKNTNITRCLSYCNVMVAEESKAGSLVLTGIRYSAGGGLSIYNIFAKGCINSRNIDTLPDSFTGYIIQYNVSGGYSYLLNGISSTLDEIRSFSPSAFEESCWGQDDDINGGLPYIKAENSTSPLFSMLTPSSLSVRVRDNTSDEEERKDKYSRFRYLKSEDNSLVLFYTDDIYGKYSERQIDLANSFNFFDIFELSGVNLKDRNYRLNLKSSDSQKILIRDGGRLRVVGTGSADIIISSRFNSNFRQIIHVFVMYGVSSIDLYINSTRAQSLNEARLDVIEGQSTDLFLGTKYTPTIVDNGETKVLKDFELKSSTNVDFDFYVNKEDIAFLSQDTLNDYVTFGDLLWIFESDKNMYHASATSLVNVINSKKATTSSVRVYYVPYVSPFVTSFYHIPFDNLDKSYSSRYFDVQVIRGAKDINFKDHISSKIQINQLQTAEVTVKVDTDFESEEIVTNFESVVTEQNLNLSYNYGEYVKEYKDGFLKSISRTYHFFYTDKLNEIKNNVVCSFEFWPVSSPASKLPFTLEVVGQSANEIYAVLYSDISTFPQNSSTMQGVVYSGISFERPKEALLAIDIYPHFSHYSKIKVSYTSSSGYSLSMVQESYNLQGSGELFSTYLDSGSVIGDKYIIIQKATGQDTYLMNVGGKYSLGKSFFIGMFVESIVPDGSIYYLKIEVLDEKNAIVSTKTISFVTQAKKSITLDFDQSLKGSDDNYYIPINTKKELFVKTEDKNKHINWDVSCLGTTLSPEIKQILTPKEENGRYFVYIDVKALGINMACELIGKTIVLTAKLDNTQISETRSIAFIITLFNVTGIVAVNVNNNGRMVLPNAVTVPLQVRLTCDYGDFSWWYHEWYMNYISGAYPADEALSTLLTVNGYEIVEDFSGYIRQLEDGITKVKYSESMQEKSGVWFYSKNGSTEALEKGRTFNDSFRVDIDEGYMLIWGIQTEITSSIVLLSNISYSNLASKTKGLPNVVNYYYYSPTSSQQYHGVFKFSYEFLLSFQERRDIINAIPIASEEDFMNMTEGNNYRLVKDIELAGYIPFSTPFQTFDGNNYTIYITSFGYPAETTGDCPLSLFTDIKENVVVRDQNGETNKKVMVYNVSVCYTGQVRGSKDSRRLEPVDSALECTLSSASSITFGGIAVKNMGIITNCQVKGNIKITPKVIIAGGGVSGVKGSYNGGLVTYNMSTGFITNSKVKNFGINCYGETGGFVYQNDGKIISSYFDSGYVDNASSENVGGFVAINNGSGIIRECFSQGVRSKTDIDICNTGGGLQSRGGDVGGFVFHNSGLIADSYSNLRISSSHSMAGFVYEEDGGSKIDRCYSISYKNPSDNNTTTFPFVGPVKGSFPIIVVVRGELNDCYFLNREDSSWANVDFYLGSDMSPSMTPDNKKAVGLDFDNFAMHTNFVGYNLSLSYNIEDQTEQGYADGYTWVIIKGKPLLVSTLIDTISQQDFYGKKKTYYDDTYMYYDYEDLDSLVSTDKDDVTDYADGDGNLLFSVHSKDMGSEEGIVREKVTYSFPKSNIEDTKYTEALEFSYTYEKEGERDKVYLSASAEYGNEVKTILDVEIKNIVGEEEKVIYENPEYRANNTIDVRFKDDFIVSIEYKELKDALYFYSQTKDSSVGDEEKQNYYAPGSRVNPILIYDDYTFCSMQISSIDAKCKIYRFVSDIDLKNKLISSVYSSFKGMMQGNYMDIKGIAISYFNNKEEDLISEENLGLFAKIISDDTQPTIISNLSIYIDKMWSTAHHRVGGLAGTIESSTYRPVLINNVKIIGVGNAGIQGLNAVGGISGYAKNKVVLRDVECKVNVSATLTTNYVNRDDTSHILYLGEDSINDVCYAGEVVGIFDVDSWKDTFSKKNYSANNITVETGRCSGTIVGCAFGLVGRDAIVDYVNVLAPTDEYSYVLANGYAGGIAGENRGRIISSSVKSGDSGRPIFGTGVGANFVAIGGIVGLNNGGWIKYSISKVSIRNKRALIVGGAVGRMVEGDLYNVVTTGSLMSKKIVGGLIGAVDDREILTGKKEIPDGEHPGLYIYEDIEGEHGNFKHEALKRRIVLDEYGEVKDRGDDILPIEISSCVSAISWLVDDYTDIVTLNTTDVEPDMGSVCGFIGLTYKSSTESSVRYIGYTEESYFSNTLYSPSGSVFYLKATYTSPLVDNIKKKAELPVVLEETTGTPNSAIQKVFAYSRDDLLRNGYISSSPFWYSVTRARNEESKNVSDDDEFMDYIYTIENPSSSDIFNMPCFYTHIENNERWKTFSAQTSWSWLSSHFGKIYYKNDEGVFYPIATSSDLSDVEEEYSEDTDFTDKLYFIENVFADEFNFSQKYSLQNDDDIMIYDSNNDSETEITTSTIKTFDYVYVDGLRYHIDLSDVVPEDKSTNGREVLEYTLDGLSGDMYTRPDGGHVTKIVVTITRSSALEASYILSEVEVYYKYINENMFLPGGEVKLPPGSEVKEDDMKYFDIFALLATSKNATSDITEFRLDISPRKVAYAHFQNGYWGFGKDFLSHGGQGLEAPNNLQLAETYTWKMFESNIDFSGDVIQIWSAKDLAAFSDYVNSGNSCVGKEIRLSSDIDLSGKYWIPIGTKDCPFAGTFNGQDHTIKYVSVNVNSNEGKEVEYAGLFGYVAGTDISDGAIISNLTIASGEVQGKIAGGLCAYAIRSTVQDIVNTNNAIGIFVAGGIVGELVDSNIYDITNYSKVKCKPSLIKENDDRYDDFVYVGGIVGRAYNVEGENLVIGSKDPDADDICAVNYGKISVIHNITYYASNSRPFTIYVGGIIGQMKGIKFSGTVLNEGEISVETNAHKLYLGGVCGSGYFEDTVKNLRNIGKIYVIYNNICSSLFNFSDYTQLGKYIFDDTMEDQNTWATCDIGGIFGYLKSKIDLPNLSSINKFDKSLTEIPSMSICNNLGEIDLRSSDSNRASVSIGGLIGRIVPGDESTLLQLSECYNGGDIDSSTIKNTLDIHIGGLVGLVDMELYNPTYGDDLPPDEIPPQVRCQVINCYNSGFLRSTGFGDVYVGGLIGLCTNVDFTDINGEKQYFNVPLICILNSMDIGDVVIFNISRSSNALGSIISDNEHLIIREDERYNNFYLRNSAHSGGTVYKAYCQHVTTTTFDAEDKDWFAQPKISDSLKDLNTFKDDEDNYIWDFEKIWKQEYKTWYPTLRNNSPLSFWSQNQEKISNNAGVYIVERAEQLAYLADQINSGLIDSKSITIKLARYIDLSNKYWVPIGTDNNPFKGEFDGSNYVVGNLTIDGSKNLSGRSSISKYGALFGCIENAQIHNLCVDSPNISNSRYVAGVVGRAKASRISYVYTRTNEEAEDILPILGRDYIGGIVAFMEDSNLNSPTKFHAGIYCCYNNIPVSVETGELSDQNIVGGLVGSLNNSYIANCYNSYMGKVTPRMADVNSSSGCMVVGSVDESCKMVNVFNIFGITADEGSKVIFFEISSSGTTALVSAISSEYELLPTREGSVDEIWITEYSLNPSEYAKVPTIRGLGKEWKNSTCESLVNFDIPNIQDKKSAMSEPETYIATHYEGTTLVSFSVYMSDFASLDMLVSKVYLISSEAELAWVSTNVNNGNLLTKNSEFVLVTDIDLSGAYWTPIGTTKQNAFEGIFNFNGHVIRGMTIDAERGSYFGLFGYIKNAKIINGYIDEGFIKVDSDTLNLEIYAGALAGYSENSDIINMFVSSTVSIIANSDVYVGGLVGYVGNPATGHVFKNIKVKGAVNTFVALGEFTDKVVEDEGVTGGRKITENSIDLAGFSRKGKSCVGGIVGYAHCVGVSSIAVPEMFSQCDNSANMVALSYVDNCNSYAGGIVGYSANGASISQSVNTGSVKTFSMKFDVVGGIVGYINSGNVLDCLFNGYIESRQSIRENQNICSYVGGIVGMIDRGNLGYNVVDKGTTRDIGASQFSDIYVGGILGCDTGEYRIQANDDICTYKVKGEGDIATGFNRAVGYPEKADTERYSTDFNSDVFNHDIWSSKAELTALQPKFYAINLEIDGKSEGYIGSLENLEGFPQDEVTLCVCMAIRREGVLSYTCSTVSLGGAQSINIKNILDREGSADMTDSLICYFKILQS